MSHSWLRIYIPQIHQAMDIRNRECCFHMVHVEYVKMSTSVTWSQWHFWQLNSKFFQEQHV